MLRPILWRRAILDSISYTPILNATSTRYFASKRGGDANADEADLQAARQWLAKLDPDTIPRDICEVSFSRSSGPGGQNVNK